MTERFAKRHQELYGSDSEPTFQAFLVRNQNQDGA